MTLLTTTPRADGFRMPGEFEPHDSCWMIWPYRPDVWRDGARPGQAAFLEVAAAIGRFEPVNMLIPPDQAAIVASRLPANVTAWAVPSDDSWCRDSGPTFVINDKGERRGIDWGFNAYGGYKEGLYFPWDNDALLASRILSLSDTPRYKAPIILEGGAIHVDGDGTLITTPDCLVNSNRNPDLSLAEIESILQAYLNIDQIYWLDCAVAGDETGGHIDQLACFVKPGVVMLSWTNDPGNPYFDVVRAAYETLSSVRDARGRQLTIHKLMLPEPMFLTAAEARGIQIHDKAMARLEGMPIADCYINFYIANGAVIVPTFNQPKADVLALETIARVFPKHHIIPVYAREIGIGGGLIHCITQQQPAAWSTVIPG